ncbi:MAG: leucyl/phenylalanyl-tRNA--protein transferase [Gammaproteobacteria bacterium]|jgi:leucyl/phenylalanyl-tRNA--protein transferase|nr:leucyl/phenylalanyl-tRNA--protein transferase [Gammaproteobacteria bacterium]
MPAAERRFPVLLDPHAETCEFPDVSLALTEPAGLLAVGGSLAPDCLLRAYRSGIFPWYEEGQPILWWSPDPRLVLFPERLRVSRSLRKTLRNGGFEVGFDRDFPAVIRACGEPRAPGTGTWITREMIAAYERLHRLGHAHSVEVWHEGRLVGGLYGVALGRVFFGESMFHRRTDASKVAFVALVSRLSAAGFEMIDCQMETAHLRSLGAETLPRAVFIEKLIACDLDARALAPQDPRPAAEVVA